MWEDFMRGNWPTVAPAIPEPRTSRDVAEPTTLRERQPGNGAAYPLPSRTSPAHIQGLHAAPTRNKAVHHATGTRKFAVRTVVTAGAGLLLAVVLPGSAIASSVHTVAHGAHAAVVSRP
jgi:hypothetical protein